VPTQIQMVLLVQILIEVIVGLRRHFVELQVVLRFPQVLLKFKLCLVLLKERDPKKCALFAFLTLIQGRAICVSKIFFAKF
jgi:hypothetical protein